METLLFSRADVAACGRIERIISAVRGAFVAHADGTAVMPPKTYIDLPGHNGDFRSMPAYVDEAAGVKWVNAHPDNPASHDLPSVMGVMIYSDPETGRPLAIMDGTELTRRRTAAAAAVATDVLAIGDADSLGLVGAGGQSLAMIDAIATVRELERLVVHDPDPDARSRLRQHVGDQFEVIDGDVADAGHCDVLCTLTPVTDPIVTLDDVASHTHINAMGADAAGKQELAPAVLLAGTIVIDDREQCTHSGEINVPWTQGAIDADDLHGTLGEVVVGDRPGRTTSDELTIFDSTGLAIQDVAAARVVYEAADAELPTISLLD